MTTPTSRDSDLRIAGALARLESALAQRPGFGRATCRSTTTISNGLRCSSTEGEHIVAADLSPALGGDGAAPSPSCLVRVALGSCLAMGYRLRAAWCGLDLGEVRVVVETESELAGLLLDGAVRPGFSALRVHVEIESDEDREAVERLVDEADRHSPVLDVVTRSIEVHRTLTVEPRSR